ncbi:uncharacterized protein LAJ45_00271 [Morchella importuna]|uniref:uncharacterized protein n=1 Tax=Morchella importuna TaxID=1174673 RepID=UPI001E8CDF2D|nr:uncharacterized protein LAJ45_00271 [Morchella importuna]KAH8155262.1 hypothetical protein LAJ45_00271 [Morchella importuna]
MASWSPTISPDAVSENWSTVLLSLRDLRRDVPINYNQYPGIALTPACFADGSYTEDRAACVANLIAIGYRSFLLDLYLDGESGGWGICPVADTASSTPTTTPAAAATASLLPRQSAPAYTCTPSFNATSLLTIFDTWMTGTNTDLGARILLLTLSLHPATTTTTTTNSSSSTTLTAPPQPLTSTLKSANILADAYTPTQLLSDRRNLNSSWHDDDTATTNTTYFTTLLAADDTVSTPDGWPSESYLEFKLRKRVLITFGNVSAAVSAVYDPAATADNAAIFPAGYIGAPAPYNASTPPQCFYNPSNTSIAAGNSSWAQALTTTTTTNITALINCGYSTLLNPAVGAANTTASLDTRFRDYEAHIRATAAWAWADNQPQNTTGRKPSFRCAAMRVSDGRWFVADCNEWRRAACRVSGQPYDWTLTPTPLPYASLPPCISTPRTPLENTHLHTLLLHTSNLPSTDSIWLDLNSLSTDSCWVSGGANASCPYTDGDEGRREVIVSAVAAVIVLVVFGLCGLPRGRVGGWRGVGGGAGGRRRRG